MYNHDAAGTRCNPAEDNSPPFRERLKGKNGFSRPRGRLWHPFRRRWNSVRGRYSGTFYALWSSGAKRWTANVGSPITDSALVTDKMVIFGDLAGYIHG